MIDPHPEVDGRYRLTTARPAGGAHLYVRHSAAADGPDSPWQYEARQCEAVQRAMLVYAHPDDEIIFAAGLMLAHPGWEWTLVRAVHGGNDRAAQHADAVAALQRWGVNIWNTYCFLAEDEWLTAAGRSEWADDLQQALTKYQPHVVFTHGARGEYGHPHHIALHHMVHTYADNVWDFLHPSGLDSEPQLIKGRVHVVPTDGRKLQIMQEAYPDMLLAIDEAQPQMIEAQFTGRHEYYTR